MFLWNHNIHSCQCQSVFWLVHSRADYLKNGSTQCVARLSRLGIIWYAKSRGSHAERRGCAAGRGWGVVSPNQRNCSGREQRQMVCVLRPDLPPLTSLPYTSYLPLNMKWSIHTWMFVLKDWFSFPVFPCSGMYFAQLDSLKSCTWKTVAPFKPSVKLQRTKTGNRNRVIYEVACL